MKKIFSLLLVIIFSTGQVAQAGMGEEINSRLKNIHTKAQGIYDSAKTVSNTYSIVKSAAITVGTNIVYSTLSSVKNTVYNKAIWARDKTIFKPGFWDTPNGREHKQFLSSYIIFITGPAGAAEGLVSSAGGLLTAGVARYAPSLAIDSGSWALQGSRLIEWAGPKAGQGVNYIRPVSNIIWGNPYVRTYIRLAGAGLAVNTGYGLSPLKSPAYNAFADNNGRISYLMNEIRQEEHLLAPGKYNDEILSGLSEAFPYGAVRSDGSYDRAAGPFGGDVFSYGAATPEKIKRYFEERGIKTNERVVAYTSEIVSLNTRNQNLANDFNWYEKTFTGLAGLSDSLVTPIGRGLDNSGVPFAGAFVKTAGSFNPLTGLSIGANAGANPSQSWRGFADFVVNPLEAGIGLRRGSIVDGRLDYHSNYRNLGEAAGSLFILRGGSGEVLSAAKSAKTQLGSLSFPSVYAKYKAPVSMAVVTLPLATAALWEGGQTGDLGTPVAASAVMSMPFIVGIAKNKIMSSQNPKGKESKMDPGMQNAVGLLSSMAEKKGENIMGKTLEIEPSRYEENKGFLSQQGVNKFIITPQLLTAKAGDPIILVPAITLPSLNNNFNDKETDYAEYLKKLQTFQKIHQTVKKEKAITAGMFKNNDINLNDYKEYQQTKQRFAETGTNFDNFMDNFGSPGAFLEAEVRGYQIVEAINSLERRESLNPKLKKYESFAQIHIENNKIRRFLGMQPLEYDPLQIGFGGQLVRDYLSFVNKNPSKNIYDLACGGGKTEEVAIVTRYLSELYPKQEILYPTTDSKLVEEFVDKPILYGARVNKVKSGSLSRLKSPYKKGINVFDTHTLLELASKKNIRGKTYIEERHLFPDEPQSGMQSAELVISKKGAFQAITSRLYRKRNENIYHSLEGLEGIIKHILSKELNKKITLDDLRNNKITDELISKGIIVTEENGGIRFNNKIHSRIAKRYTQDAYFHQAGELRKHFNYGTDINTVINTFADMLVKKDPWDYSIYKMGEYAIRERFTGEPRPHTRFGGKQEGVLRNLQAQIMAIKHNWNFSSFEKILMDKTKHASNYVSALDQAGSVSAFSGTGNANKPGFEALGISLKQIGPNYDTLARQKTNIPKSKVQSAEDSSIVKVMLSDLDSSKEVSLRIASSPDAQKLKQAHNEFTALQEQTRLDSSFDSKQYKTVIPKETVVDLITYDSVRNIQDVSEIQGELKTEFIRLLIADKSLPEVKNVDAAHKLIAEYPLRALAKFREYTEEYGAELDKINYQQKYKDFMNARETAPSQQRILLMQGLIEGSNVAKKISGDGAKAKMFLFGLNPEANVLQAGQRIGITPTAALRRMPGEFYWPVDIADRFLTTQERASLSNAKTPREILDIQFKAAQRMQLEINAQNIYKVSQKTKGLSALDIARNLNKFEQALNWGYIKATPSAMSINSVMLLTKDDKDKQWAKTNLENWIVPESNVLNKEGLALVNLAQKLMSVSFGFSSFREAFEFGNFLYQNKLLDLDAADLNVKANSLEEKLSKFVFAGQLVDKLGLHNLKPEEVFNSIGSDLGFYKLVSEKLKVAQPEIYRELNEKIGGDITKATKRLNLEDLDKAALPVQFSFLFLPNLNDVSKKEFDAAKAIDEILNIKEIKGNIDKASIPVAELLELVKGKITPAQFIAKYAKDATLKIYAQRIAQYENTKIQIETFKLFGINLDGKIDYELRKEIAGQLFAGDVKKTKEFIEPLQKNIDFFSRFGIKVAENRELDLSQLKKLSDDILPAEELLNIYYGFRLSDEGVKEKANALLKIDKIKTYKDLKVTAAELNSPNLAAVVALLIPSLSNEEIGRFSLFSYFIEKYSIDADSKNLFELIGLTADNKKVNFVTFIIENIGDSNLKKPLATYAENLRYYEQASKKQKSYNRKGLTGKEKSKQDLGLQESINFFKDHGIDLTKKVELNKELDLDELKKLADDNLQDNSLNELLVTISGGLKALKEHLEQVKQEEKAKQVQPETVVKSGVVSPAEINNLPAVAPPHHPVLPVEATVNPGIVATAAVDKSG